MNIAEPTAQDIENAATRAAIAERQNAAYHDAEQLALEALGAGWTPWMKLCLIDADHRRTGNVEPVATVFKVCRGDKRLSENAVFIRRMPDGPVLTDDSYKPLFGDLLTEPHPTRTIVVRGQQVPVGRYELVWGALELYSPRSAESLAAARARREEKAVEREAQENPLFSEQIRAEGPVAQRKPRGKGRA